MIRARSAPRSAGLSTRRPHVGPVLRYIASVAPARMPNDTGPNRVVTGSGPISHHTPRKRAELSDGRACRYRPVVATEACPSVACTRWIGAPRSRLCEAWACRSQCAETSPGSPASAAAAFTARWTALGSSAPPFRERNTGSSADQVAKFATCSCRSAASTCRRASCAARWTSSWSKARSPPRQPCAALLYSRV